MIDKGSLSNLQFLIVLAQYIAYHPYLWSSASEGCKGVSGHKRKVGYGHRRFRNGHSAGCKFKGSLICHCHSCFHFLPLHVCRNENRAGSGRQSRGLKPRSLAGLGGLNGGLRLWPKNAPNRILSNCEGRSQEPLTCNVVGNWF